MNKILSLVGCFCLAALVWVLLLVLSALNGLIWGVEGVLNYVSGVLLESEGEGL